MFSGKRQREVLRCEARDPMRLRFGWVLSRCHGCCWRRRQVPMVPLSALFRTRAGTWVDLTDVSKLAG
jgi:hypothetical protein